MRSDDEQRRRGKPVQRRTAGDRWRDGLEAVAARTGVSPRAVAGLLVVGVVVLAVLGTRVALVQARAQPVPVAPRSLTTVGGDAAPTAGAPTTGPTPGPSATGPSPAAGPAAAATASATGDPSATGSHLVVHVVGRVARPGVVRLAPGARVQDALEAAGGARRGADLARLNLARVLVDGEQVAVPRPGETVQAAPAPGGGAQGSGGGSSGGPATPGAIAVVDLNTASLTELDTLPGVGPVLAQRILDWRTQNGRFTSVDELGEVSGIGDAVLSRLRPLVRV